jgi:serine/threonine protein kinase
MDVCLYNYKHLHLRMVIFTVSGALGLLLYEMLTGHSMFSRADGNQSKIMAHISAVAAQGQLHGRLTTTLGATIKDMPLQSLITALLVVDPAKRLTHLKTFEQHPCFRDFSWTQLRQQTLRAPIVPALKGPADTTYFKTKPVENIFIKPEDMSRTHATTTTMTINHSSNTEIAIADALDPAIEAILDGF